MTPRLAVAADLAPLTDLWERRWHDAHAASSPPELIAIRTRADFATRLAGFLAAGDLWVIGPEDAPNGFVALKDHHLDQLYVDRPLEGTGAARVLMDHGLAMLAGRGIAMAELWCNTGNARAAAFYRKTGWRLRATEDVELDSASGPFWLACLVFEHPTGAVAG